MGSSQATTPNLARLRSVLSLSQRTKAERVHLQVRPDRLTGRRAQLEAELRQQLVPLAAIQFADVEHELRPSRRPHQALDLGCELVALRQLQIIVLDPQVLRLRL